MSDVSEAAGVVVPGVPAGWELVRIGRPDAGEWCIDFNGDLIQFSGDLARIHPLAIVPIIRRVPPVCEWPLGVFADGWISQDEPMDSDSAVGEIYWYSQKPVWKVGRGYSRWVKSPGNEGVLAEICPHVFRDPLRFRDDVPFERRIQQVGPKFEAGLAGGGQ